MTLPPGTRVELYPAWFGTPGPDSPAVYNGDVMYVTPAQMVRLEMGDSVPCINLAEFAAETSFRKSPEGRADG